MPPMHPALRLVSAAPVFLVACGPPATIPAHALEARPQDPQDVPEESKKDASSRFVRLIETGEHEGRLELAIGHYRKGDVEVDLIAAVHIADAGHYQALQKRFQDYDALLFELVGTAEDARHLHEREEGGPVSMLQRALKTGLDLEFQLDGIEYTPDNFVHADLTPREFQELSAEKGESLATLMFRSMIAEQQRLREAAEERGDEEPIDLVTAFRERRGRHMLRWMMAQQLQDMERVAAGFAGPDGESVLVEGRNARCMEVLDDQIEAGVEKIGIYYGAAHMTDMEERLRTRGFEKVDETWWTAWDLNVRPDPDVYVSSRREKKEGKGDGN